MVFSVKTLKSLKMAKMALFYLTGCKQKKPGQLVTVAVVVGPLLLVLGGGWVHGGEWPGYGVWIHV